MKTTFRHRIESLIEQFSGEGCEEEDWELGIYLLDCLKHFERHRALSQAAQVDARGGASYIVQTYYQERNSRLSAS